MQKLKKKYFKHFDVLFLKFYLIDQYNLFFLLNALSASVIVILIFNFYYFQYWIVTLNICGGQYAIGI